MSQPNLSLNDLKHLSHKAPGQHPVVSLWTQETTALDLFQQNKKDDGKLDAFRGFCEKILPSLNEAFLLASEKVCECVWSLEEPKPVPGAEINTHLNLGEDFCFACSSSEGSLSGYYALEKSFFFKIYDLLFGGKRLHVKTGDLSPFERDVLMRLFQPLHGIFQAELEKMGAPSVDLGERVTDADKILKESGSNNFLKISCQIKEGESVVATFRCLLPQDILRFFAANAGSTQEEAVAQDMMFQSAVRNCIEDVAVNVKVSLGVALTSLKNILNVKAGDEWGMMLPDSGHLVEVGDAAFGLASIGEADGQRAVQILEIFKGE